MCVCVCVCVYVCMYVCMNILLGTKRQIYGHDVTLRNGLSIKNVSIYETDKNMVMMMT